MQKKKCVIQMKLIQSFQIQFHVKYNDARMQLHSCFAHHFIVYNLPVFDDQDQVGFFFPTSSVILVLSLLVEK